jgi:alpha-mannosidase
VPFAEAAKQEYRPFAVGEAWGRPWGTVWFHVTGTVPAGWAHPELVVDLGFTGAGPGFQAEGTVYSPDGVVLGGIEPRRRAVPLPGGAVDLYVEAAANPDMTGGWGWAPTPLGDLATAGDDPLYRLGAVELADLDRTVWGLLQDIWTLNGLVEGPARRPPAPGRGAAGPGAGGRRDGPGRRHRPPQRAARAELADVLARPAHASAHRVYAVGHAHIDSAWLWPVRETVRKVTRTFANALQLMETDEELVFAASSAQQYAWMRDHQPELFARIRKRTAEGRFAPVGGMWVESDTNMPGGEALARQLVYGAGFFAGELGVDSDGVWLPDSFGYSAALPQIAVLAGRRWLLTQKISWNDTNRFPHHTFDWEGIDGTRIRTHFPPVDTYNAELSGGELARAQRQFAEKGRANTSLVPFGWGDGGGGPTREMLAAAHRTRDPRGLAHRAPRPSHGVLRRRGRRVPGPAGMGRRAVPGVPPRHVHHPVADQARQPAQRAPAARGRAVGHHRSRPEGRGVPRRDAAPLLGDGAAAAVPRHPAGHVDRVGAPAGRAGVRPGRRGAGGGDRRRADAPRRPR